MTWGVEFPAAPAAGRRDGAARPGRRLTRLAFYGHLWLGVLTTLALAVISVTGVLLNHKRGLALMPDVPAAENLRLGGALSLERLARIALDAAGDSAADATGAAPAIDRMDVRPRDGYVKVRLRDREWTEVTVGLTDGRVMHVGPRRDVFLEQLHSGQIFGDEWVLLSDVGAVGLVVVLATGYWLWLHPKRSRERRREDPPEEPAAP